MSSGNRLLILQLAFFANWALLFLVAGIIIQLLKSKLHPVFKILTWCGLAVWAVYCFNLTLVEWYAYNHGEAVLLKVVYLSFPLTWIILYYIAKKYFPALIDESNPHWIAPTVVILAPVVHIIAGNLLSPHIAAFLK